MGTPLQIAQSIREQANALSLYVNVGVASNIDSAMHAARVAKEPNLFEPIDGLAFNMKRPVL